MAVSLPRTWWSWTFASWGTGCSGGDILIGIALVPLLAWLHGILGVYDGGEVVYVFLLLGLTLLLAGLKRAIDARRGAGGLPRP